MAYILSAERYLDDAEAKRLWEEYEKFIQDNKATFPPGAYALATSDWYYGFSDHRAPHDAWLEWAKLDEPSTGERNEVRHQSLRIRLLGAYHDMYIEFFYPIVHSFSMGRRYASGGMGDWLYDEFRLSPEGHLIHEIEWASTRDEEHWIIEASDVEFSVYPRESVASE
jgi:hypothetical protein